MGEKSDVEYIPGEYLSDSDMDALIALYARTFKEPRRGVRRLDPMHDLLQKMRNETPHILMAAKDSKGVVGISAVVPSTKRTKREFIGERGEHTIGDMEILKRFLRYPDRVYRAMYLMCVAVDQRSRGRNLGVDIRAQHVPLVLKQHPQVAELYNWPVSSAGKRVTAIMEETLGMPIQSAPHPWDGECV